VKEEQKPQKTNNITVEFPTIRDTPLESADRERKLDRSQITQPNLIQGGNKAIILSDGKNTRLFIGEKKGLF